MFRQSILCLSLAAIVASTGQTAYGQAPPTTPSAATTTVAPVPVVAAPRGMPRPEGLQYRLGIRDKVRVIVFNEQSLSGEFFVNDAGRVSLPLIGEVQAAGLTVQDFQTAVETEFRKGYLREPRVSAEVLTYRPFYILGEVNKPGEYPFTNGLNVLNAVATAGGFTYRAQTKRVYIRRAGETKEQSYSVTSELAVAPGDTIRVGERFF
jgi:polysaccharide export outer membrane protein